MQYGLHKLSKVLTSISLMLAKHFLTSDGCCHIHIKLVLYLHYIVTLTASISEDISCPRCGINHLTIALFSSLLPGLLFLDPSWSPLQVKLLSTQILYPGDRVIEFSTVQPSACGCRIPQLDAVSFLRMSTLSNPKTSFAVRGMTA